MTTVPEPLPEEPEGRSAIVPAELPAADLLPAPSLEEEVGEQTKPKESAPPVQAGVTFGETPFLATYGEPILVRPTRIPHLGHLGLFLLLLCLGWIVAGSLLFAGLHYQLFGISTLKDAIVDFRYAMGSQAIQYFVSFACCLLLFPPIWHKGLFEGLQWRGATALKYKWRLISVAIFCFFAAMLNGLLMPGPTDAPIDRIFRAPGAPWVLFGFGVTLAPFFEELAFRGFLLPALCTAYDWTMEQLTGAPIRPIDENGHPQWSVPAMMVASALTSLPFALMHGEQTSYSLGPFVLLIFISLVLCWMRLSMRSLAASTMVHACYNFLLFSFMLMGTGGFKHLDRM